MAPEQQWISFVRSFPILSRSISRSIEIDPFIGAMFSREQMEKFDFSRPLRRTDMRNASKFDTARKSKKFQVTVQRIHVS